MPGLYDIGASDIKSLDDLQLTKLLDYLISSELAANGVRRTNAYVSLDINVPDGGADGLVLVTSDTFPTMDHIISRVLATVPLPVPDIVTVNTSFPEPGDEFMPRQPARKPVSATRKMQ